jgi:altronate dehydratase small subunit
MILGKNDNVAIAVADLNEGEKLYVENTEIILKNSIKFGHKFAIKLIRKGESVVKYGEIIGVANVDIVAGELVHVQNIDSLKGVRHV